MKEKVSEIIEKYPASVFKNRKQHILVVDQNEAPQTIAANTRTIPGIITSRGCCYAGCKGVVIGPLKDVVTITHGPIGCGYYSWGTRRNKARVDEGGDYNYLNYCFSTDLQERDIVFGGEKKLRQAITEVVDLLHPPNIMICSTCPVGLIGDDINAVAAWAEKEYGIPVMAFSCEGYKGVTQSAGHHIANNGLMKRVIGSGDEPAGQYSLNLLGEYNIGGDGWEVERLLRKIGYEIVSVMTGNGSIKTLKNAHKANLNLVQCHRSINYIAEMINTKYGTDWLKVNYVGVQSTADSLRYVARYFDDPELTARTEAVIEEELAEIMPLMQGYRKVCEGKTAAMYVGGSRALSYQDLFADLGMETILAGFEFAHRDDYEGREVLPFVKEDADSKNIETLVLEPDEQRYRLVLSREKYEALTKEIPLNYFSGMIKVMKDSSVVIDDINHHEIDEFIKLMKPDIFCAGIKEKYQIHKAGIFSKQLHSYDYSGPYAGFKGAVNFARDIAMGLSTPVWSLVQPPWKTEPSLEGFYVQEVV
ncbi:MAG TPA: nitrogenase molybdenum-iron protein alpha chain [Syntrophomonadaceae bacterium]|nr:nitrogenase molybdenum-iron protein alpha chain [Syntrophomonadaceae bacterium]